MTLCAKDCPGLFSKFSGVFTLNNIDILNANIYTWGNRIAVDIFMVTPPRDELLEDEIWDRVQLDLQAFDECLFHPPLRTLGDKSAIPEIDLDAVGNGNRLFSYT